MKKTILISKDPKRMFGTMAKPGEIIFGTHTHLITKPKAQPNLQQLLIEAQKKAREAKLKHKAAQRSNTNPIQIKITELRHLQAVEPIHQLHRSQALKDYNALQKQLKNKTTNDPKEFLAIRNSVHTLANRVRFIENLIDLNKSQQETVKRQLIESLRAPVKLKAKKSIQEKRTKRVDYTLEQQKNLDILLDSLNEQKRLETKLLEIIKHLPQNSQKRVHYLEQLKGVRTNLRYLPGLLTDESQMQAPKIKTRVQKAKEAEKEALQTYDTTARILNYDHPQQIEMRLNYFKAKRSRLFEEGRLAKPKTQERAKIDAELRTIEKEIASAEKERTKD